MHLSTQSRIAIFLYALFAAVVLCSIPLYGAEEASYTIRTSVNEVRLTFAASDDQGHVLKTLRSSDVVIVDNESIIRHFLSFRSAPESPLDLVILIDASDSVESHISTVIAEVNRLMEDTNWGERDSLSILAFGGLRPMLLCRRNCNAPGVSLKLSALRALGATPLYDALLQAAEILNEDRNPESRPAMILFSDGVDTISMHSATGVLQAAQNLQSAIYTVNSRSNEAERDGGGAMLDHLAERTGGLSFPLGRNVRQILRVILEDLHSGYVLTYQLPEPSTEHHSIRVLPTSDPRLKFRSRQAYDHGGN